ncbi:MAG: MaoC/PaaZ C-terminal domain-containing protein [Pseudomonadota bacterium]
MSGDAVDPDAGPGELTCDDVGVLSTARTTLIDTRMAMAYAAAVNDTNPSFYDDLRPGGVAVHPGICFTLQWAARYRPDVPLNPRAAAYGVHASTDLRLHRPFRTGEAVTTQGRVVARRQIRPGVFSLDRYRMVGSDGELIAELDYNGITRGATLRGADRVIEAEPVAPDPGPLASEPLWSVSVPVPLHLGQQYTECARIYNPIHTEPSVARAAGLPGVILHGSATKAMALSVVVNRVFDGDAAAVTRLCGQLRAMVLLDTQITVDCMADRFVDGERRIGFRVRNASGEPAIVDGIVCART